MSDCVDIVRELLSEIDQLGSSRKYHVLNMNTPSKNLDDIGLFVGSMTPLMAAMMTSRYEIVSLLLDHGSDPYKKNPRGADPCFFACASGNLSNITFWLNR